MFIQFMGQPKSSNYNIAAQQKVCKFSDRGYSRSRGMAFTSFSDVLQIVNTLMSTCLLNECMLLNRYLGGNRDGAITKDFQCLHYFLIYFQIFHHVFNNESFIFIYFCVLVDYLTRKQTQAMEVRTLKLSHQTSGESPIMRFLISKVTKQYLCIITLKKDWKDIHKKKRELSLCGGVMSDSCLLFS